jgi:hypothetical protein
MACISGADPGGLGGRRVVGAGGNTEESTGGGGRLPMAGAGGSGRSGGRGGTPYGRLGGGIGSTGGGGIGGGEVGRSIPFKEGLLFGLFRCGDEEEEEETAETAEAAEAAVVGKGLTAASCVFTSVILFRCTRGDTTSGGKW